MKITKKIVASILIILVFLCLFLPNTYADFFDGEDEEESEINKTIDEDDGGIFEKIIAKMIRWNCRNCS